MNLVWHAQSLPKAGHAAAENEDALAISRETNRVAVCDGASEGWRSGAWANHLAKAMVSMPAEPMSFARWLEKVRAQAIFQSPQATSWYAEEKSAEGAYCTLLGLSLSSAKDGGVKFHAVAVGDTTLFQVRGGKLIARFPIEKSVQFSNRPALVGSTVESGEPSPEWFAGRADTGDDFYVLTDAVAEWFLKAAEAGELPWESLNDVTTDGAGDERFSQWVQSMRDEKRMKNDDATLVRVRIL